jgi:hypothetical protein
MKKFFAKHFSSPNDTRRRHAAPTGITLGLEKFSLGGGGDGGGRRDLSAGANNARREKFTETA